MLSIPVLLTTSATRVIPLWPRHAAGGQQAAEGRPFPIFVLPEAISLGATLRRISQRDASR